jgi:hypothetical protein
MNQAISTSSVTGFASELAALLIENEASQADADRAQRDAARGAFLHDAEQQVNALHAAADATEAGALLSGTLAVAGGACEVGASIAKFDADSASLAGDKASAVSDARTASILQSLGKTSSQLAAPAKAIIGDAAADDDRAQAKQFETLAEQAKWQAGDASTELDHTDKLGDKILDIVQSLQQAQAAATNAVIGRI